MKLAGLTGGIATGKSTVAQMFEELGARIIDADAIAREIVRPGKDAYNEVVEHFGNEILTPDGRIDRERLGAIVFDDENERRTLESITHPRVFDEMQRRIKQHAGEGTQLTLCDVPLLFESGAQNWLKPTILVYTDPKTQLERLTERDECSEENAMARISSQMPIDEKKKLADIVIDNSGDMESTRSQVEATWKKLIEDTE